MKNRTSSIIASAGILLTFLGASCASTPPVKQPTTLPFEDSWNGASDPVERAWPGADWHATRQEDWRMRDGGVECVNAKTGASGRTLALLTRTIQAPIRKDVHLSFEVQEFSTQWRPGAHVGVLFGVGGNGVHYKRSALVQQAPAEDGGWLLSVNSAGMLRISSFHNPLGRAGYWTLPGGVNFDELPVLAEALGRVPVDQGAMQFTLRYQPHLEGPRQGTGQLTVSVTCGASDPTVLTLDDFHEAELAGSLSLFSALGAEQSKLGFAFKDFQLLGGRGHEDRAWGPILAATYLVDRAEEMGSMLRLTAHLAPLGDSAPRHARLWLEDPESAGQWKLAAMGERTSDGSDLVKFEVPGFSDRTDGNPVRYRVEIGPVQAGSGKAEPAFFHGSIRPEPGKAEDWVLASLSCLKNQMGPIAWNQSGMWFPHEQLVDRVTGQDPDFLYFSGDQIYEGDLTGPNRKDLDTSIADYQTKYRRFLWAFGDLLRDRPSVLIPDDHDVFHGNLWGAGGVQAKKRDGLTAQDSGGYRMPTKFVNVVHASLTSNLPPSKVSPTIGTGITTYTTDFVWGGIDFAVLADRMWKDSPSVAVPEAKFRNGWIQAQGFDPADSNNTDASLLGAEQEEFLTRWATDQGTGTWTKVVLSQSPFACLHSLPADTKSDATVGRQKPPLPGEYPANDAPVADGDSNGWPQGARHRAVALLRDAGALHLCGDQHLGTVSWYGVDSWRDGTLAFTSPAMGNTWPRRWMPASAGANRPEGADGNPTTPRYTGDYTDGFGNRITMLAVANPEENGREPVLQMNRAPGFGLIRFQPKEKRIVLEAWPTWDSEGMYPGWPIVVDDKARPVEGGWK